MIVETGEMLPLHDPPPPHAREANHVDENLRARKTDPSRAPHHRVDSPALRRHENVRHARHLSPMIPGS
jgi:hypothetical protein